MNDCIQSVAGLRLLEDQEHAQSIRLLELGAAIQAGDESNPGVDAHEVLDRLEHEYQSLAKAAEQACA
jgi:hypothetical protein